MAKDHFVPRHYLRRFTIIGSEEILVAKVSPYRFMGRKGIGGQCQEANFYNADGPLDKLLWQYENDIAPVLVQVTQKQDFNEPELLALRWLAVSLNLRTRKAAEAYKVLPRRLAAAVRCYATLCQLLRPGPGPRVDSLKMKNTAPQKRRAAGSTWLIGRDHVHFELFIIGSFYKS